MPSRGSRIVARLGSSRFPFQKSRFPIENLEHLENLHFLHVFRFWGHICGKFMENICLKAPEYYSAPFGTYNFSIC